ncbi:MAG: EAL domain-containing protein [Clostridia bacterium]|nr:EAL domain-containing protein [Clostridia bacterium]
MNGKVKFERGDFIFVILILVSIAALVNVFVLVSMYSSGTQEQALLMSSAYAESAGVEYRKQMDFLRSKAQAIATMAAGYADQDDLERYLGSLQTKAAFGEYFDSEIRYYVGDKEYNIRGEEITEEIEQVTAMRSRNELATYGIVYTETGSRSLVACYCPVEGGALADGLVMYFPQEIMLSFVSQTDAEKCSQAELMAVCCRNYGGAQILSVLSDKTGKVMVNDSFYDSIKTLTNDVAPIALVTSLLDSGESQTINLVLNNQKFILSVQRANPTDAGVYVIAVFRESSVYASGNDLVQTAIITMAILLAVLFTFAIYFLVTRRRINKRIEQINMVNPVLNCPTLQYFEREARFMLSQNKKTQFAIVVSHVQHFAYILEKYGESGGNGILRHLRDIYISSLAEGEIYGYISDGEYALLLHYKDVKRLENRLMSLYAVARKHLKGDEMPEEYDLKMLFGIFCVEDDEVPVNKMVDNAVSVCDMPSRTDINHICNFYDANSRSNYMMKAEIENRMDSALAAGEFRVFYQPKYNLDANRIDGAELLVRWYDPETKNYRSPAEFLPVFESNGFISKLDRHIYYTACEMLAKWVEEGRRVFPISVNISRVTAIQPDFLTYYIKVKKFFNIADDFITLEFTESFAYENYEHLSAIVKELHKAGFQCSIDDFGTGYSTYNVLKLLDMDEIKLDKFFLDPGSSEERDRLINRSVIEMGRKMGLKVTQEGVETIENLEMLRECGCNVIQGYFFARPMNSSDYLNFIERFFAENPVTKAELDYLGKN